MWRNLAEQFLARGHEVHIIAPSSDDETEPDRVVDAPVHRIGRVVSIPANGSVARITLSLRSYLQAKRLLQEEQFDLIHLHEPMMPALPLTVLRHSNATNIGTFHAFRNTPLTYFYGKPILQPVLPQAARTHRRLERGARLRRRVLPGRLPHHPQRHRLRALPSRATRPLPSSSRRSAPTVLFVGRLEKRKGLRFLLRAWPMVLERQPEARLVVVGRGRPLEGYRRFAARQGWSPTTSCLRRLRAREDLPRYYQSCDVFCAPNTGQESFGIVLLEAMAAGAPIVASDIPGYRDVAERRRARACSSPRRSRRDRRRLCRLLGNPELRASMRRAGQHKARDYDWPRVATEVLDYYEEVLERRERGARAAARPLRAGQAHGGHAHARCEGAQTARARQAEGALRGFSAVWASRPMR